jgi:hypothetical protein
MGISKMLMELAYNFVLGLIAELIEWMIMIWIPALAAAPVTFGGSTAVAGAQTAYQTASTANRATRFIAKVNVILARLKVLLRKISASGMTKAGQKFRNTGPTGMMTSGYKGVGGVIKDFATDPSRVFSPSNPNSWVSKAPGAAKAANDGIGWGTSENHQSDEEIEQKLGGD